MYIYIITQFYYNFFKANFLKQLISKTVRVVIKTRPSSLIQKKKKKIEQDNNKNWIKGIGIRVAIRGDWQLLIFDPLSSFLPLPLPRSADINSASIRLHPEDPLPPPRSAVYPERAFARRCYSSRWPLSDSQQAALKASP